MKKIRVYIVIVLFSFICFPFIALSQQASDKTTSKIDSLKTILTNSKEDTNKVNILNKLSYELNYSDIGSAEEYALQALEIGEKLNFNQGIIQSHNNLGIVYKNLGKFDLALENCQKSIEKSMSIGDSSSLAGASNTIGTVNYYLGNYSEALVWYQKALTIYKLLDLQSREAIIINNLGLVYSMLSNYNEALEFYFKSLKIQEKNNNMNGAALTLGNIGIIYFNLGDTDKALDYYEKSLKIRLELNDEFGIATCYSNMGNVYENRGETEKAMNYYFKALEIYEVKNDLNNAATTIFCIGYNYLNQSKYNKAIEYLSRSRDLCIKFGNKSSLAYAYMNIGLAYLELHKYNKSLDNLKNGLELFTKIDDKNYISYSYNSLSRLYEATGNYKESLEYFKKYSTLRDSIFSEESSNKIAQAEVLYETEKKENSIQLLTKEKKLQSLQIEKQEYFRNFFIALSILILVLGLIVYSRFVIKRKANKLLEEKNNDLLEKNTQIENQKIKIENQSEKLKELDETKSRFFANISHEFRTPLMLIRGPLDDYINDNKSKLSTEEFNNLKLSLRNANNLQKLIEQLLDLSKLESGKLFLRAAKTNLIPFVRRIIDSFASAGKLIDIKFKTNVDELFMYFDEEKLEKVMNNLLSNAYKFVPKEGEISIIIDDDKTEDNENVSGSFISIKVKDTGQGITKEDIPYIFDRFYQADNSSVRKYEGTGIGLALTKELIELHGGTISVESNPDNYQEETGTTFTIQLPKGTDHLSSDEIVVVLKTDISSKQKEVNEFGISPTPKIIDKNIEIKGSNILVVEDNFDMRNYIAGHLSKDYNITEAINGKEGLNKVMENIPDLIISDLMMPEMDGVQFLKEIRNNNKTSDIPFILLTARAGEQDRIAGLKAKADDYLTKPFSPEELKTRIRNILETRQNLEEKFSQKILSIEFDNPKLFSADKEFLKKMRDTVIENISDSSFNINNLIDKAFLSERQLRRRIKELTGLSPLEFIRQIRLLQAKELLSKQAFNSIAEISVAVGFNNPHYFSRLFKNMFGKSPAEFTTNLPC